MLDRLRHASPNMVIRVALICALLASTFVIGSSSPPAYGETGATTKLRMVEPFRIAVGAGSTVEYVISGAVLIAAVIVSARMGEIVFRRAIVRTGRRLRLGDVLTRRSGRTP